jgi:hypothetical protein
VYFNLKQKKKIVGIIIPKQYDRKITIAALDANMNRSDFLRLAIHNAVINGLPPNLPCMEGMEADKKYSSNLREREAEEESGVVEYIPSEEFEKLSTYLLAKNHELYQRLATATPSPSTNRKKSAI